MKMVIVHVEHASITKLFLYQRSYLSYNEDNEIEVHYDKTTCGDFFAPEDLEPYIDLTIPEELFEL